VTVAILLLFVLLITFSPKYLFLIVGGDLTEVQMMRIFIRLQGLLKLKIGLY
jgi:hypothetical protein